MNNLLAQLMIDPYRWLMVNLLLAVSLGCGVVIYKYIYPKKIINLFYLLLLISFLPVISILREGGYESGDLAIHAVNSMYFYQSLMEGNIFPRWAGELFSGYGGPLLQFQYTLPYYIISAFHLIGFSFLFSTKLLLIISYILAGIFMFLWIKDEFNERSGFAAAILYLFTPYLLIDLHFRVSVGEVLSFVFLPLGFLLVKKIIQKKKTEYILLGGMVFCLMVLSHLATSLAIFPLIFLYGVILTMFEKVQKKRKVFKIVISFVLGVALSSFSWLPAIMESKFVWYGELLQVHDFKPLLDYLYSNVTFGLLLQGHQGETHFIVGYAQLIIIVISIYLLLFKRIRGKKDKTLVIYSLLIISIFFLMMQSYTQPIWDIQILRGFQFPWRLLTEIAVFTSLLTGIVIKYIKSKKFLFFIVLFVMFSTFLNWGNRRSIFETDKLIYERLRQFPEYASKGIINPIYPIWVDVNTSWMGKEQKATIEILQGSADLKQISRTTTKHVYNIIATSPVKIRENTFYYPGWKLKVNEVEKPIQYSTSSYPGLIVFDLPKGNHIVELTFQDTSIMLISEIISVSTAFGMLLVFLITTNRKSIKKFQIRQIFLR